MPGEWEEHSCTWMGWPCATYTVGDTIKSQEEAYKAWASGKSNDSYGNVMEIGRCIDHG
jgi:hypothetical protein